LWLDHSPNVRAYLVAVVLVAATVATKLMVLVPLVGGAPIVVGFLLPVTLAAWYGGRGPGLAALAMAAVAESLLLSPAGWPGDHAIANILRICFMIGEGVVICVMAGQLHKERMCCWTVAERLAERLRKWTPAERLDARRGRAPAPEVDARDEI